jgi:hypothetical protein
MNFLLAVAAMFGIGLAFGVGCLLAMHGYSIVLAIIFLGWLFAFAKLGCLPPADSHH